MLEAVIVILGALAAAVLVNFFADRLPALVPSEALAEGEPVPAAPRRAPWAFTPRNVAVALVLIAAAVGLLLRDGFTLRMAGYAVYVIVFALVAIIDIEHRLILDVVMVPAFVYAFIELLVSQRVPFVRALAGYATAQVVVVAVYLLGMVYLWWINRGRPADQKVDEVAFGFGDVTLATFCGLVLGYPSVVLMLVLMVLIGGAMALLVLLGSALLRRYQAHTAIPYGPSIILACAVMLFWGEAIARALGAS